LGDDDVLPKEFLEGLLEMSARIERGEEKLIPFDGNLMEKLEELIEDVELNDEEPT
jgi:hypothetical protein